MSPLPPKGPRDLRIEQRIGTVQDSYGAFFDFRKYSSCSISTKKENSPDIHGTSLHAGPMKPMTPRLTLRKRRISQRCVPQLQSWVEDEMGLYIIRRIAPT